MFFIVQFLLLLFDVGGVDIKLGNNLILDCQRHDRTEITVITVCRNPPLSGCYIHNECDFSTCRVLYLDIFRSNINSTSFSTVKVSDTFWRVTIKNIQVRDNGDTFVCEVDSQRHYWIEKEVTVFGKRTVIS